MMNFAFFFPEARPMPTLTTDRLPEALQEAAHPWKNGGSTTKNGGLAVKNGGLMGFIGIHPWRPGKTYGVNSQKLVENFKDQTWGWFFTLKGGCIADRQPIYHDISWYPISINMIHQYPQFLEFHWFITKVHSCCWWLTHFCWWLSPKVWWRSPHFSMDTSFCLQFDPDFLVVFQAW